VRMAGSWRRSWTRCDVHRRRRSNAHRVENRRPLAGVLAVGCALQAKRGPPHFGETQSPATHSLPGRDSASLAGPGPWPRPAHATSFVTTVFDALFYSAGCRRPRHLRSEDNGPFWLSELRVRASTPRIGCSRTPVRQSATNRSPNSASLQPADATAAFAARLTGCANDAHDHASVTRRAAMDSS
jgi:hypothetical protein